MVSNLPYNVSVPLVLDLLRTAPIDRYVVTVQREVGERLVARPGEEVLAPDLGRPDPVAGREVLQLRAAEAARTLTEPYASSPGPATSRSPTSRCTITT